MFGYRCVEECWENKDGQENGEHDLLCFIDRVSKLVEGEAVTIFKLTSAFIFPLRSLSNLDLPVENTNKEHVDQLR